MNALTPERKTELLNILRGIENQLSPENLTCDGELPPSVVRRRSAQLHRERRNVINELGYEPDFKEIYPEIAAS